MSTDINLYKINKPKKFKKDIIDEKKYLKHHINKNKLSKEEKESLKDITLKLYYFKETDSSINWEWIINKFDESLNSPKSKPKAKYFKFHGSNFIKRDITDFRESLKVKSKYKKIRPSP